MAKGSLKTTQPETQPPPEPNPDPPTPEPSFADKVNALIDEAIAKGERPVPVLASIVVQRGGKLIDDGKSILADFAERLVASLEGKAGKK